MNKMKEKLHMGRHGHKHEHEVAAEEVPINTIVPGSVPVTGTYSRTEAEYQAAMGNAGVSESTRTGAATGITGTGAATGMTSMTEEVGGEHPVAVGVAEVPVVVTEQERVVSSSSSSHESYSTHRATEHMGERMPVQATERVSERDVGEEVCGQKTFTQIEDRPVIRERVERIVEHRPVEKQYVVETRFVGEREVGSAGAEIIGTKERVVEVAEPGPTCPANTGAILNEVVSGMSHTTISTTDRL